MKGKLAELRRWLEQFPLVKIATLVRVNCITALFTSLPKKYIQKMENLRQMLEKMEIFYEEMP